MKFKGWTVRERLVSIVVVGLLSFFFLPAVTPPIGIARKKSCACNLRQIYQVGVTYASSHQGRWPAATGSALWQSFTKTSPPLLSAEDLEVLLCPVKGDSILGDCDYLGPRQPASSLKGGDALGACTHGHQDEESKGWVLLKDGSVKEVEFSDPLWGTLAPP